MTETPTRTAFIDAFRAQLDRFANAGRTLDIWWRDDDAVAPTDELKRMASYAVKYEVPIGLAVIPNGATEALAAFVSDHPKLAVLQHGWQHKNHQPKGSKAAELGDARPLETVLGELQKGNQRLADLFGDRFKSVLVPPWNRISDEVAAARSQAGLSGLSTFAAANGAVYQVNCHLDPIAWKTTRGFIGWEKAGRIMAEELDRRLDGSEEPFGLLTHHLVHDGTLWDFIEAFLEVSAGHPSVRWPEIYDLFGLNA